eukprot:366518-Chlamydomonas_euryale.AAC.9
MKTHTAKRSRRRPQGRGADAPRGAGQHGRHLLSRPGRTAPKPAACPNQPLFAVAGTVTLAFRTYELSNLSP